MKLHYSQTKYTTCFSVICFNTLWNYTTLKHQFHKDTFYHRFNTLWNYTTLKHCTWIQTHFYVLIPYEITLLSNTAPNWVFITIVLIPYEITLLSNGRHIHYFLNYVLIPYEITLLSNPQSKLENNDDVLIPYEITLLSNTKEDTTYVTLF